MNTLSSLLEEEYQSAEAVVGWDQESGNRSVTKFIMTTFAFLKVSSSKESSLFHSIRLGKQVLGDSCLEQRWEWVRYQADQEICWRGTLGVLWSQKCLYFYTAGIGLYTI